MSIYTSLDVDLDDWERGDTFTAEQLLYLYQRDPFVQWRIDDMTEDATRNWLNNFPDDQQRVKEVILQAMKWSQLYGDAIVIVKKDLLDVFHPLVDGVGYETPTGEDLDEMGYPKRFKIKIGERKEIVVDAEDVVIFPHVKKERTWRGYSAIGAVFDDIIDLRKWRKVYGKRASKVAVPSFHVNRESPWTETEKQTLKDVFGENEVAATHGNVKFETIGGVLQQNEIESVKEALMEALAAGFDVNKTDLKGAEAGQKLSTDANQGAYQMALVDIQKHYTPYVKEVLRRLGIEFGGWNTPWEESEQVKIQNIQVLTAAYLACVDKGAQEIAAIIKDKIVNLYGTRK